MAGEIASNAPAAIADAARKLLLEKVSPAFPCSRLALGAADFQKAPLKGHGTGRQVEASSIASFFKSETPAAPQGLSANVAEFHKASRQVT